MATARFIGADEVVKKYRETGSPFFSMWCKTQMICQFNEDDLDKGEEIIREEIDRNIKRGFGAECYLKIHSEHEKIYTIKSATLYNLVFKSFDDSATTMMLSGGNGINFQLLQTLNVINSRLTAIEKMNDTDPGGEDDEDDEDDEDEQVNGILSGVDKVLAHPVIGRLIDKFLFPENKAPSIAGVPQDESLEVQQKRLNNAISTLFQKGVTIEHFEKLANMPAVKIKSLLTML